MESEVVRVVKEAHLRCAGHQTAGVRTSYLVSLFAQACVLHFAISSNTTYNITQE